MLKSNFLYYIKNLTIDYRYMLSPMLWGYNLIASNFRGGINKFSFNITTDSNDVVSSDFNVVCVDSSTVKLLATIKNNCFLWCRRAIYIVICYIAHMYCWCGWLIEITKKISTWRFLNAKNIYTTYNKAYRCRTKSILHICAVMLINYNWVFNIFKLNVLK